MMNKFLAIGIVAVIIVAGFMFLFPSEGDDSVDATAIIYIENVDTGTVMVAEMDISQPSQTEQMLLNFGGIRETDFAPLDFTGSVSSLSYNGNYIIWVVTKVKITATDDIASLTKITADWSGKPGAYSGGSTTAPDHATTTAPEKLYSVGSTISVHMEKTSSLAFGTEYSFDQSSVANGKYNRYYNTDSKVVSNLIGDRVDGATITCSVAAYAIDDSGATVVNQMSATLKISVGSWTQSLLSIEVTGMSAGSASA